jgi:integrase
VLLQAAAAHIKDKYSRAMEAQNVYLAIALMALAGLRKREVCFARWDWIDWDGRMIAVNNDEHFTTKNKRSRLISMNAHLGQILQPFRKEEG